MTDMIKWCNNNIVWGVPMLILFTAVGILFTVRLKCFQIFKFPYIIKNTFLKKSEKNSKNTVSPLRALTASLGTTLGTGNIIAVGAAVAIGGAGAVFWMWTAAIMGMITCYAENYLAHLYRDKSSDFSGVPFTYIKKAFGSRRAGTIMAGFFAVCCIGASFGMGNMAQINSAGVVLFESLGVPLWITGAVCAVMTAVLCSGGLKKLTDFTVKIVPAITVAYIIGCIIVIAINIERLPTALSDIFTNAFSFDSVAGGGTGIAMLSAMKWGVKRGVFSNEAGLGTSVIINSDSTADSSEIQGMWSMLQVFIDTIVMCSMTALCILCSDATAYTTDGTDLAFLAFNSGLGSFAGIFLAVTVLIFALSTAAGWYLYGKSCVNYLFGKKFIGLYFIVFVILAFLGAIIKPSLVWELSDFFNGIMAIPNLLSLIILRKEVK